MKRLIFCRHGAFDANRHLSYSGKLQIRSLAWVLRPYLGEDASHVRMLTSKAPRAIGSARLLMERLDIDAGDMVASDSLWTGDGPQKHDDMIALLQVEQASASAEVLLVMTHLEYCESLPSLYAHRLGLPTVPRRIPIHHGQARVLDCQTGECAAVGRIGL